MADLAELGTYLKLWDQQGDCMFCVAGLEPSVDAAVQGWVSSGRTQDSILYLELLEGDVYKILASEVSSWLLSTPNGRRQRLALEAASEAEEQEFKHDLGIFD